LLLPSFLISQPTHDLYAMRKDPLSQFTSTACTHDKEFVYDPMILTALASCNSLCIYSVINKGNLQSY
jgi:hypothetical protein